MQNTKRQLNGRCVALMALALSSIPALDTQAQYQLSPFYVPDYFGFPSDINNNGTIALNAFFTFGPGGFEGGPVLVKGDSVTPLSVSNGVRPRLEGINSQGTTVGTAGSQGASGSFGFVMTKQGEVTSLTISGFRATRPLGINSRGVVVGSVLDEDFLSHGFIWDSSGPKLFDAPGAEFTELQSINASGTAVGNYGVGGISHAFTFDGARFLSLDIPDALSSSAYGINSLGQIVGSYQSSADLYLGFIYDRGQVTPVDYVISEEYAPPSFPPEPFDFGDGLTGTVSWVRTGRYTDITGINDRGHIIGSANVGYAAVVECGGCGLTPDDFGGLVVIDTFTGERDGSRNVTVKNAGKRELQKIRVPRGTSARGLQFLMDEQRP